MLWGISDGQLFDHFTFAMTSAQLLRHKSVDDDTSTLVIRFKFDFSRSTLLLNTGAAYVPILLSEVEQEQRPSENADREAIVVGSFDLLYPRSFDLLPPTQLKLA